jgi:hypothetical protein
MTRAWVAGIVLAALSLLRAQDAPKVSEGALTLEDVLAYAKQGMTDEFIINQVKRNAKPFDLNSDEVAALRDMGISDAVIGYMRNPSQPYTPPPPPAPTPTPTAIAVSPPQQPPPAKSKPPSDPRILKLPPEAGIYYLKSEVSFDALDLKPVVPSKQPGKMASLSGGLLNGHIIGSLIGEAAKTRATGPSAIFFFRLGEKASIDDLALLSVDPSGKQRDLDFGKKPGKPVFPVSSVKQFESKEIVPGIYRLTVPLSKPGEYLFFILGSGDEKKGLLGKGYDFGVDKPGKTAAVSGVTK